MAETSLPVRDGRRAWRPVAIVAAALAAVLVLAVLADGRLLVADPDPSVVTEEDVRLARALFGDSVPPELLAEVCLDDDGTIDPACLDDGQPGGGGDVTADVVPRACRDDDSIDAGCLERELGIDLPDACVDDSGGVAVGCAAGAGRFLALTDRCIEDGRMRQECLEGRVYGVPDPGPEEGGDGIPAPVDDRASDGGPDRDIQGLDEATGPDEEPEAQPGTERPKGPSALAVALRLAALALLVGLALAGLVWVVLGLTGHRPGQRPVAPEADPEDDHDRAVMAASLDAGARHLDLSGDPRQAIIAAYAQLLDGLAACAQARWPSETPLEHLERVLHALDVRPDPLRELTTLFGEARFSIHEMTDTHRDRARAALEAAAVDLERVREAVG